MAESLESGASIMDLLKPTIEGSGDGACVLHFEVRPEFTIPGGVVQGGITTAMLDMAMAISAGGAISTASLHVEILRPVVGPTLRVHGRIVRQGRRIVFAEAEMTGPDGKVCATGRQTAVPIA